MISYSGPDIVSYEMMEDRRHMKDSLNYADYHVNFYAFFMDQYTFETMRLDPSIGSFTAVEIQNTYNE